MAYQLNAYQTIGKLGKTFGLEGWVRFKTDVAGEAIIASCLKYNRAVFVQIDSFKIPFFIKKLDQNRQLIQFKKINSQEELRELTGASLFVDSTSEFSTTTSQVDRLAQFTIFDEHTNFDLGRIIKIEEYPAHPMATVRINDNDILIPLVEEFIVDINPDEMRIIMKLPEGLYDLV